MNCTPPRRSFATSSKGRAGAPLQEDADAVDASDRPVPETQGRFTRQETSVGETSQRQRAPSDSDYQQRNFAE